MGYLTYAISKRGYNVKGMDISPVAVRKANNRYGNNFICADIQSDSEIDIGIFDVILCIGMIEHVVDPTGLIKSLNNLLKIGGQLILTTPDKSSFPNDAVWETDNPPIHLWWFTRKSIEEMGLNAGYLKIEFIDLNQGPEGRVEIFSERDYTKPICQHIYNREGKLIFKGHHEYVLRLIARNIVRKLGLLSAVIKVKRSLFVGKQSYIKNLAGPANMCAILTK